VAAYVTGGIPGFQKEFIGAYLLNSITNSGTDASDDRSAAFLTAVGEEQAKRKTTVLNDSLICELSRKVGVRYVCAVATTAAPDGSFTLSGRVISAKTGKSRYNGEAAGQTITMGALAQAAETLLEKMFGGKRVFSGQTAPEPAPPAPQTDAAAAPAPEPAAKSTIYADDNAETAAADNPAAVHIDYAKIAADQSVAAYVDTTEPVVKPPSMRVKNVAVVETEIDAQSGASGELTSADARLVTAELRREAVKNLPRGRYNVMTSETVYAQGSAVLEECIDENCVIVLGSAIGADFIVRGIISKVQTLFTLSVEIYETDNGNLVASSDPIRSESLGDLLEQARVTCGEMYKTFVDWQTPTQEPTAPVAQEPSPKLTRLRRMDIDLSVGVGAIYAGNFGGGIVWSNAQVTMPYSGGGVCLFASHTYASAHITYLSGGGRWESDNDYDGYELPDTRRIDLNIGLSGKYPITLWENITVFPTAGLDYNACASARLVRSDGSKYPFDGMNGHRHVTGDLNELWVRIGAGTDVSISWNTYVRGEFLYGARLPNAFEQSYLYDNGYARLAHGLILRVGAGIRL
jgi:hypothetical protein